MTRALVIYESVFGNARTIAHGIADGLSASMAVDVVAAGNAPAEIAPDVGLLVVGGPTHMLGMPRPSSREGAVKRYGADIPDSTTGLHEWLEAVRPSSGIAAAAFDTRSRGPRLLVKLDHAARSEEKLLRTHGATVVTPAEHFFVADTTGPLVEGEEDRARHWGRTLAGLMAPRPTPV